MRSDVQVIEIPSTLKKVGDKEIRDQNARGRNGWFCIEHIDFVRMNTYGPIVIESSSGRRVTEKQIWIEVHSRQAGRTAPIILQLDPTTARRVGNQLREFARDAEAEEQAGRFKQIREGTGRGGND